MNDTILTLLGIALVALLSREFASSEPAVNFTTNAMHDPTTFGLVAISWVFVLYVLYDSANSAE